MNVKELHHREEIHSLKLFPSGIRDAPFSKKRGCLTDFLEALSSLLKPSVPYYTVSDLKQEGKRTLTRTINSCWHNFLECFLQDNMKRKAHFHGVVHLQRVLVVCRLTSSGLWGQTYLLLLLQGPWMQLS